MTIQRIETAGRVLFEWRQGENWSSYKGKTYDKIKKVEQVAPGKFEITTLNGVYKLEGGKKLGGSRKDWFLEGPHIGVDRQGRNYMVVNGLQDALHLLEHEL